MAAALWAAYVIASVARRVGPDSAFATVTSVIEACVLRSALLVLIWFSGSAASPLWVASMIQSFVWTAKPPARARVDRGALVASYAALALAFFVSGKAGDAALTVLVFCASMAGHTLTARMAARSARVRAERDVTERRLQSAMLRQDRERMAREIHDGVGADVTALLLRLRRAARSGDPKATGLAEKAHDLLDELRGVVWSLRNEQGTLAELGKLVDATCRGVRGGIAYERTTPLEQAQEPIAPSAALAVLSVARELVRAAARSGVTKIGVTLAIAEDLEVTVEDDGPTLSPDALAIVLTSVTQAAVEREPGARIDVASVPGRRAIRARISGARS